MENCVFCKIVEGVIPCNKIYENKDVFVFLDNGPVSDGHLLIIPKKHMVWMQEADDETISLVFKTVKKMMITLIKSLKCDYVGISVGGTDVPHFHVHAIPRYYNDNLNRFPSKKYKDGEAEEIAKKITEAF